MRYSGSRSLGIGPVNGEQQTGPLGTNSIISTREWSGSNRFSCTLPSRPIWLVVHWCVLHPFAFSCAMAVSIFRTPSET